LTPHLSKLSGAEITPGVIATASTQNPTVDYRIYDGKSLPFSDAVFDLVFTICVVHHVPLEDRNTFFAEMRRVTKPGGMNIIFEQNPYNPVTRRVVSNCPFDEDAVLLKPKESRSFLSDAGLTVVEQRYFLFFPWRGRVTTWLESCLSWLPLGAQYFVAARL
jgi:ubiquinone/menaquinone biosynthesis C-methylase UbiE